MSLPQRNNPTPRSNLAQRFITAVFAVPVLIWLMYWAPPVGMVILALGAVAVCAFELFAMTIPQERLLQAWGVLASLGVALTAAQTGPAAHVVENSLRLPLLTILAVGSLLLALARPLPAEAAGMRMAWLLGGPLYIGLFLIPISNLHGLPHGGHWVLLCMMLAWFGDTGAYFAGRFFGKRKLYPAVSPKKTVEGAIGGFAASLLGALAVSRFLLPDLPLVHAVILTAIASPLGICGDLFASLIKRSTQTKDSGWILPGHGGLLDRVDALMFTCTSCWLYATLVLKLG